MNIKQHIKSILKESSSIGNIPQNRVTNLIKTAVEDYVTFKICKLSVINWNEKDYVVFVITEKPIRRLPNPYNPGKREEELPNPEAIRGRNTPKVYGGEDRPKHFYEVGIEGRKKPYDVEELEINESKIDKVLSKYFITENETKKRKHIDPLS